MSLFCALSSQCVWDLTIKSKLQTQENINVQSRTKASEEKRNKDNTENIRIIKDI